MKQHKLGSKGNPFLVSAGEAENKFQQEKNRRMSQMLEMLDRRDEQKIINVLSKAIKEYGNGLTESMEHPDDYRAFVVNFNSVDCAKLCADALFPDFVSDPHTMIKTPHGDLKLFDPPNLPDDLSEIKSALGLSDDTPEPLVGVIWRLQQRIEDLECMVRGPYPLARLSLRDLDEPKGSPQLCGEILGNFACDEIKGHKGYHVGTRIADNRISWPQQ